MAKRRRHSSGAAARRQYLRARRRLKRLRRAAESSSDDAYRASIGPRRRRLLRLTRYLRKKAGMKRRNRKYQPKYRRQHEGSTRGSIEVTGGAEVAANIESNNDNVKMVVDQLLAGQETIRATTQDFRNALLQRIATSGSPAGLTAEQVGTNNGGYDVIQKAWAGFGSDVQQATKITIITGFIKSIDAGGITKDMNGGTFLQRYGPALLKIAGYAVATSMVALVGGAIFQSLPPGTAQAIADKANTFMTYIGSTASDVSSFFGKVSGGYRCVYHPNIIEVGIANAFGGVGGALKSGWNWLKGKFSSTPAT